MFIHLADTHLGYSDFNKVDSKSEINQREMDNYRVFEWVVDYILDSKPEFVIHAGDFFETSRPPNRTINFALSQIKRLSEANIPLIIISGNHSTPRMSASGSIFESFKILPHIYPTYEGEYKNFKIGNYSFHCIPHSSTEEIMKKNIQKAKPHKDHKNILVTHAGIITSRESYDTGEFNEQKIPKSVLESDDFSYIALGHYHSFQKIANNAYFSGATERFSFRHANYKTGFLEVDTKTFKPKFIKTPSREMHRFNIDCMKKEAKEILDALQDISTKCRQQSMTLVNVNNVKRDIWLSLDQKEIKELFSQVLVLDLRPHFYQTVAGHRGKTAIDELPIEFDSYVKSLSKSDNEKRAIKRLGIKYLNQANL